MFAKLRNEKILFSFSNIKQIMEKPEEVSKSEIDPLDGLTVEELERKLNEQLPKPENIKTLSAARKKIGQLNGLVIQSRKDLLSAIQKTHLLKQALDVLNEQNKKQAEIVQRTRESFEKVTVQTLSSTKDQLTGAFSMFHNQMQQMAFTMEEFMSDSQTVSDLLIPLVRCITDKDFGCSNGKVYMVLQPKKPTNTSHKRALFLSEWEYGVNIRQEFIEKHKPNSGHKYTVSFDPEDLSAHIGWEQKQTVVTSFNDLIGLLAQISAVADTAMLSWIISDSNEDDETKRNAQVAVSSPN